MVHFQKRKLQVFVSSTFTDLIPERQAAVEAILKVGHIPAGMELFSAGDESQLKVIYDWIDESDVYLLILGGRYGTIEEKSQKSYIQLEYEYAAKKKKPLFSCVISDEASLKLTKEFLETDHSEKYNEFRDTVTNVMVGFWSDIKDIKLAITNSLLQFERDENLKGWVRPDTEANMPAMADELSRLSRENSNLRIELEKNRTDELYNGLTYNELIDYLKGKNLYDKLFENIQYFGQQFFNPKAHFSKEEVVEISVLGLIQPISRPGIGSHMYELTDIGRKLLTKLMVNRIEIVDPGYVES